MVARSTGSATPMILHWNGTNWTQLPRANRGGLNGAAAASATNAWAVGQIEVRRDIYKILILQWNGTTWKRR